FKPVRGAAFEQSFQARQFACIRRDHELAADLMRNRILAAKLDHLTNARHREARLRRSRLIVQPAVQHAAVVAGLVPSDAIFLFEYTNARVRKSLRQTVCGGKPYDAAADDRKRPHPTECNVPRLAIYCVACRLKPEPQLRV